MRSIAAATLLSLAWAAPAFGQERDLTKPDLAEVRALAVNYELASADGSRACPLTLDARPASGIGFQVLFERERCTAIFGFLGEVSAWLPGHAGAILFIAPDTRIVAEFTEGVGGVYEAIRDGDAVYFLANLQLAEPKERVQVSELLGEWKLSRPGGVPLCRVNLSDQSLGDERFAVRVLPGCDPALVRLNLIAWQLQSGDVVLHAKNGDTLRFGRQDDGAWARVPDRPRPLLLSRP